MLRALTFLGTSSGVPTPARNVSGMVVALVGGEQWLFDCGEGTQHQLQRCKDASAGKLRRIFVTHMHGDHCYGLPGLICSMGMAGALGCRDAAPGDAPPVLELIGPVHLAAWLRTTLLVTSGGLPFRYRVTELLPAFDAAKAQADAIAATSAAVAAPAGDDADAEAGAQAAGHPMLPPVAPALDPAQLHPCEDPPVFLRPDSRGVYELGRLDGVSVQAAQLVHPVPCFGYAIAEDEAPGTLDAVAVAAAGVPRGPLFGQLKAGRPVTLPCGKVVLPGDVTGPPKPGRVLTVLGDTCDSTAMAATRAQGGSWMTHEATFDDATGPLAVARGHSTARMAGACARQLGVTERLILTHFSARFPPRDRDPGPVDGMLRQARAGAVAGAVAVGGDAAEEERLAEQCPIAVSAAEDFATFDLTRKKL